jgi:8-oxo-dGTP diphosphatase
MSEDVKVGASAKMFLRNSEGKVLVMLRSETSKRFKLIWDMPGGKVDPGETLEEALRRELSEETSLACGELTKLGTRTFDIDGRPCIETLYCADMIGPPDVRLSDEHVEHRWVSIASLIAEEIRLMPHMASFIKECDKLQTDDYS